MTDFAVPLRHASHLGSLPQPPPPGVWVDPAHPLAQGLLCAYVFNVRPTLIQNRMPGRPAARLTAQSSTVALASTVVGPAVDFSGTGYLESSSYDDLEWIGPITVLVRANVRTGSGYRHFLGKHTAGGITNNPIDFRTTNAATPVLVAVRATTLNYREFSGPSVTLGRFRTYGVAYPTNLAATSSPPTFYVDGVPTVGAPVGGTANGAVTGNGSTLRIGRRADAAVQMDGQFSYVYVWQRGLTTAEVQAVTAAPFSFFAVPAPSRRFFGGATGAAPPSGAGRSQVVVVG